MGWVSSYPQMRGQLPADPSYRLGLPSAFHRLEGTLLHDRGDVRIPPILG